MPELKERFRAVDEVDPPELWAEARRRAAAPEAPPPAAKWPPRTARRVAVGALAFAVFAVAVVFAWDLANPDPRPAPRPPAAVDLAAELPEGWTELPGPPEVRDRAVTAWTGSQLIVWGGSVFDGGGDETPADDGFIFDGASRSWEQIPAGPLSSPRSDAAGAWTGQELLIWGGYTGACCEPSEPSFLDDGAAFDPAAGSWRRLPQAPITARVPFSVWTGQELIVWGSRDRSDRERDGAAYDPSTDSWRPIADAPIEITDGSAVWTGAEMVVFGAALDSNNHADTRTDIGAAYHPATDSWRRIPDSTLSPQAVTASWAGDEMIAWDYDQASAAYDPIADSWRALPDVPIAFSECYPHSVAIPGSVLGDFCGRSVIYSATADRWREITDAAIDGWVVEQAAAGSGYFVMAHPLELSAIPNRTFDTKMFAYVPSEAPVEDRPTLFIPDANFGEVDTRMPLVFPNGTRATLVYPTELDLSSRGIQPDVSYLWKDESAPRYPIVFLHHPSASIDPYVQGPEPVSSVTATSSTQIWEMSTPYRELRALPNGHWLRYRLPSWTALVALPSIAKVDEVLASLAFQEIDGFPVVRANGRLALADGFGESEGPVLTIGDRFPDPDITPIGNHFFLSPDGCIEDGSDMSLDGYGSNCLANGNVFVSIYGGRDFVSAVIDGVRIENFRAT